MICSKTSLPLLNKVPARSDNLKHFITCARYLCKPGSLNIVPGTSSSPALVTLAWFMLHWSFIKGSWAAFKLELNNLSGSADYRLKTVLCETTIAAAAELEEATLAAGTAITIKTPSTWEHVLQPHTSWELGSASGLPINPGFIHCFLLSKHKLLGVRPCWGLGNNLRCF